MPRSSLLGSVNLVDESISCEEGLEDDGGNDDDFLQDFGYEWGEAAWLAGIAKQAKFLRNFYLDNLAEDTLDDGNAFVDFVD